MHLLVVLRLQDMDFGTIVIHVFTDEARKFYDLERLWADAEAVDIGDIILPN